MQHKTLDFGFELKSLSDDGIFEGYGSVFGVIDSYDEVVAPGAFAESLSARKTSGNLPSLLWQHRSGEPIGVYTEMEEDNIGLKVTGKLALKTAKGAEAYELLKMKAISGLSIGFVSRDDSFDRVTGIRTLKKIDLWEVSLVTFPANESARVQGVKTIDIIEDLRTAEQYLRDSGMSRREAVAFIAKTRELMQRESADAEAKKLIDAYKRKAEVFAAE